MRGNACSGGGGGFFGQYQGDEDGRKRGRVWRMSVKNIGHCL